MKIECDTKMIKRRAMRFFFAAEVLVFIGFYLFGSQGIQQLMKMQSEQRELDKHIETLEHEIALLNGKIEQWDTTAFYKEKIRCYPTFYSNCRWNSISCPAIKKFF